MRWNSVYSHILILVQIKLAFNSKMHLLNGMNEIRANIYQLSLSICEAISCSKNTHVIEMFENQLENDHK